MLENYNFLIPIKNILPHNVTGLMIVLFPASNASRTFLTKSSPGFLWLVTWCPNSDEHNTSMEKYAHALKQMFQTRIVYLNFEI